MTCDEEKQVWRLRSRMKAGLAVMAATIPVACTAEDPASLAAMLVCSAAGSMVVNRSVRALDQLHQEAMAAPAAERIRP